MNRLRRPIIMECGWLVSRYVADMPLQTMVEKSVKKRYEKGVHHHGLEVKLI